MRLSKVGSGRLIGPDIQLFGNTDGERQTWARCPPGSVVIGINLTSSIPLKFGPNSSDVTRSILNYNVLCDEKYHLD